MRQCAVITCTNQFGKTKGPISYHRFPVNETARKKWLFNCGLTEDFDCTYSRVCSNHFIEDDFERDFKSELLGQPLKKRLKLGAEPHLNLVVIKQEPPDADDFGVEQESNRQLRKTNSTSTSSKISLDNSQFDSGSITDNFNAGMVSLEPILENIPAVIASQNAVSSTVSFAPSSLPASQNWAGPHDFNISFGPQEKNTKGVSWTYSKDKDKLYVGKDAPCPINFSANASRSDGVSIRVMALYSSPDSASEVVHRCVNHSMEELTKRIVEAEHLIRCESNMATYEIDQTTKRHSVIVPFEIPPAGQKFSTYIFKFVCFGSCAGGPNRRPIMLIFSLEKGGQCVGRRRLDVKICACPGRDRKAEEKQLLTSARSHLPAKRTESEMVTLAETLEFTKSIMLPQAKKVKHTPHDGVYIIKTEDKAQYEFLKQMKTFYNMCKTVNNLSPTAKKVLAHQSNHHRNDSSSQDPDSN